MPIKCADSAHRGNHPTAGFRITVPDLGIAGAETDGLFHERDYPVYRPGIELAKTKSVVCVHPVAVIPERGLIFGDRLIGTALRS
jgi:hypothetical protein